MFTRLAYKCTQFCFTRIDAPQGHPLFEPGMHLHMTYMLASGLLPSCRHVSKKLVTAHEPAGELAHRRMPALPNVQVYRMLTLQDKLAELPSGQLTLSHS